MINKSASFEVVVSDKDVQNFAELTGDFNPLHIDPEYAANTNFEGQVAHGALLVGYISRLLGMHIPGEKCIINNFEVKLSNPVYVGSKIVVSGSVKQFNDALEYGRVEGEINDPISNKTYVVFRVDFSKHHSVDRIRAPLEKATVSDKSFKAKEKSVLVIGGGGGIGSTLCSSLAANYRVETAGRDSSKNDIEVDLSRPSSISDVFCGGKAYECVICLASDPLISSPLTVDSDLTYSVVLNSVGVVSLADNAFANGARRLLLFSSTMGDSDNLDGEFASYALGKNILNATLSLLSKKYAGRMEIYNIVLGNMFTGLTAGSPEIKMKRYTLRTSTKQGSSMTELTELVDEILSGNLTSLSGNKIRFTSGL
jgi:3-hydroxybutyryl-CoA dehydratase